MELVIIIMMLALVEYAVFIGRVGAARGRLGVEAPRVTGNDEFERIFRVQYNTLEQLVMFLPAIWVFGTYISSFWAACIGAIFVVGRAIYAITYVRDPKTRVVGMLMSIIPCWILILGGLGGVIWTLVG